MTSARLLAATAAVALTALFTVVSAPSAGASSFDYYQPISQVSQLMWNNTCEYSVWYGNYGATPFAKVRLFGGNCGNVKVRSVFTITGLTFAVSYGQTVSGGIDPNCGSYIEFQAIGDTPSLAYGEQIDFPVTGRTDNFYNNSSLPRPSRHNC
jgi:hypothetical protein